MLHLKTRNQIINIYNDILKDHEQLADNIFESKICLNFSPNDCLTFIAKDPIPIKIFNEKELLDLKNILDFERCPNETIEQVFICQNYPIILNVGSFSIPIKVLKNLSNIILFNKHSKIISYMTDDDADYYDVNADTDDNNGSIGYLDSLIKLYRFIAGSLICYDNILDVLDDLKMFAEMHEPVYIYALYDLIKSYEFKKTDLKNLNEIKEINKSLMECGFCGPVTNYIDYIINEFADDTDRIYCKICMIETSKIYISKNCFHGFFCIRCQNKMDTCPICRITTPFCKVFT